MSPSEAVELIYRDGLAHGSIWLAGVKLYLTLETYSLYYKLRKLTDGKFLTSSHIDVAVANLTERWNGAATTL